MDDKSVGVGTLGWMDLTVPDADAVRDFYAAVVGWTPSGVDMGCDYQDYNMIPEGSDTPATGVCHARGPNADLPPVWIPYFYVSDLDASIAACRAKGGSFIRTPPAPGASKDHPFAFIKDPAGAAFAIWQWTAPEAKIRFKGAYPISGDVSNLPVRDLGPSLAFYTRLLGFEVVNREEKCAALKRDDAEIGISCNPADPEQVSVYFEVSGLEALRTELANLGLEPTELRFDNHGGSRYRVFFAKEPYGVCFCFGEKLSG